jgi:hypothetical protein
LVRDRSLLDSSAEAKAMAYSLTCSCGRQLEVPAAAAGTEVFCECGARVRVPSLSELRLLAGRAAYETGTVDVIRRMLAEGSLPWGELCAVSGKPTQDVLDLSVHCERVQAEKDGLRSFQLLVLLFGLPALLLGQRSSRDPQGRETSVWTPLRVAHDHQRKVGRASQKTLRRLLRTVPVYAALLDQYPRARVVIGRMETDGDRMIVR